MENFLEKILIKVIESRVCKVRNEIKKLENNKLTQIGLKNTKKAEEIQSQIDMLIKVEETISNLWVTFLI